MPYDDTPRTYLIIVRTDSEQRILEYSCPEFVESIDSWIETDETIFGTIGLAHQHIVCLSQGAKEEHGIPLYKLEDSSFVKRMPEEIAIDIAKLPPPAPSKMDLLKEDLLKTQEALAGIYETLVLGGGIIEP